MLVTFTRTAERRYRVSVEGPDIVPSYMEPAPGYEAMLSERLVDIASRIWNKGAPGLLHHAAIEGVTADDLRRVCRTFDAVSAVWSRLGVGDSMTLQWRGSAGHARRHRRRRR